MYIYRINTIHGKVFEICSDEKEVLTVLGFLESSKEVKEVKLIGSFGILTEQSKGYLGYQGFSKLVEKYSHELE